MGLCGRIRAGRGALVMMAKKALISHVLIVNTNSFNKPSLLIVKRPGTMYFCPWFPLIDFHCLSCLMYWESAVIGIESKKGWTKDHLVELFWFDRATRSAMLAYVEVCWTEVCRSLCHVGRCEAPWLLRVPNFLNIDWFHMGPHMTSCSKTTGNSVPGWWHVQEQGLAPYITRPLKVKEDLKANRPRRSDVKGFLVGKESDEFDME